LTCANYGTSSNLFKRYCITRGAKYDLVQIKHDPKADGIGVNGDERPERLFQSEMGRGQVKNETKRLNRRLTNFPQGQQAIRANEGMSTGTGERHE
jgi:hypothetical protein